MHTSAAPAAVSRTPPSPMGVLSSPRSMPRRRAPFTRVLLGALATLAATPAAGQAPVRHAGAREAYLALNVGVGTVAALARAAMTGAPLRPALAKGLVGGSLTAGGMYLIGTEARSARLAGIQLTALGAGIVRNADGSVPLLSDVTLPAYPFYIRVRPGTTRPVTARLSVASTARLLGVMIGAERAVVDWGETLVTGVPVLRSPTWRLPSSSCPLPCEGAFAKHLSGVVLYSASAGTDYDLRRTLAHESMHVVQHTRDALLHAVPASDAMLRRLGAPGRALSRFVVVDLFLPFRAVDAGEAHLRGAARRDSWYELEARAFAPGGEIVRH